MASDDSIEGADLMVLRSKFGKPAASGVVARRTAEKRANLSQLDGRRSSRAAVVRDAQINFKVASSTKERIVALARARGIAMVDILEEGLAILEAEHTKKLKGA